VVLEEKKLPPPPPPPPPPKVDEKKPEVVQEKPPEKKPEPKPEPKKIEPKPQETKIVEAREVAMAAGINQIQDMFSDMRDTVDMSAVNNNTLALGNQNAAKVDRSVITSGAVGTSGGINTAALSRNTGGIALSGRETTVVESNLATRTGSGTAEAAGVREQSSRSEQEIRKIMDKNGGAIHALYNRALRSNPALQGKVVVRIVIQPTGQVSAAEIVSSGLNDPDLEAKLLARIRLIAFDAKDVTSTTINWTFDFFPN
jgi:TonB family protein